ncbi:Cof-type HAD-IIB family hydrolase [Lactobacillus sp. ESL0791]|uniref:Cof-type HAD-IIB family hydrolase n=1 Tax=Lactobacillus sp. ESL0791 TaxID=2983234 RepID=UPI0023F94B58|nr:Cof-type HAD-IIB family hydrolase [Lactobacillus sp. ESL0791]MDF7639912.1 Cof-type HAD-IIB family hydrolase [Lactobacillus sp. ESL0791]
MAKLIFSDIDGTLLNSDLQVTPKTRIALRQQIIAGNVFIPVSGRMPQAIMTAAGQVMKTCPMIAYNGALVIDEMGRPLSSQFMTAKQALEICQYVEENAIESCSWSVYSGNDWYCSIHKSQLIRQEEKIVAVQARPSSIAEIKNLRGVHKVLILGKPEKLDQMKDELQPRYPKLCLIKSAPNLLEVVLKGVSKGDGIRVMAQEFNVPLEDCWAFGDNYNDEAMLKVVGHPVLMANAPSELKKKFRVITSDNNHDGMAVILNKLK